jgi:hypothetical protein
MAEVPPVEEPTLPVVLPGAPHAVDKRTEIMSTIFFMWFSLLDERPIPPVYYSYARFVPKIAY